MQVQIKRGKSCSLLLDYYSVERWMRLLSVSLQCGFNLSDRFIEDVSKSKGQE